MEKNTLTKTVAGLLLMLGVAGCHNYSTNIGETLGCTLAGNGCKSQGDVGATGAPGLTGAPGAPGTSCSVSTVAAGVAAPHGGAIITCGTSAPVLVVNGAPGATGPQGQPGVAAPSTPYTIVSAVTPCPSIVGAAPEVLLVLQNRQILASASESANGKNTRLSFLGQGNWQTTDGRSCNFTVGASTISWGGGSSVY